MIKNIYVMIGAESIQFKKPFLKKPSKLKKTKNLCNGVFFGF